MTKDEALKLAFVEIGRLVETGKYTGATIQTMQAIKEALMSGADGIQPQPWEKFCDSNCVWTDHHPNCKLAEQSMECGEPVAWRNAAIRVGEDLCSVGPFGYYDMTAEQWLAWALSVVTVHAPPPQRKPLTDEEIKMMIPDGDEWKYGVGFSEAISFARVIEAAHGIKGEA